MNAYIPIGLFLHNYSENSTMLHFRRLYNLTALLRRTYAYFNDVGRITNVCNSYVTYNFITNRLGPISNVKKFLLSSYTICVFLGLFRKKQHFE